MEAPKGEGGLLIAGGILTILAGAVTIILALMVGSIGARFILGGGALALAIIGLILGVISIVGGGFACAGRNFGLSLTGGICATTAAIPVCRPVLLLAILGLVFIAVRRSAFS